MRETLPHAVVSLGGRIARASNYNIGQQVKPEFQTNNQHLLA